MASARSSKCTQRAQIDFLGEHRAHEVALLFVGNRLGNLGREDLHRVAVLDPLEQLHGNVEVAELVIEHPLPDRLDAGIGFLRGAAVVVVDLVRLVHHPLLEPVFGGIT